jgi:DNA sulfur modification protein DndC
MGPLTFEARLMGLDRILGIQARSQRRGARAGPAGDQSLINAEEEARIRELIALETWPHGWDGDEPTADTVMETVYQNGACSRCCARTPDGRQNGFRKRFRNC